VVPVLAEVAEDHPGFLDLRPREWEVLAEIDGTRDLRAIATMLAQSEFDVARVAYGLLSTGIVELRNGEHPLDAVDDGATPSSPTTIAPLEAAASALHSGETQVALAICERITSESPELAEGHLLLARVLNRLGRRGDAALAIARGLEADPLNAELHAESGYCAAWCGDFLDALASWERSLRLNPGSPDARRIRAARDAASRLRSLLQEHIDV
jgi:tetratricopeptide (TPR) repeat protein